MLRSITGAGLLAGLLSLSGWAASPWPDQIGDFKKTASKPVTVTDRKLWAEYGLISAEQADYTAGPRRFTGESFQLKDPTGAYSAFEWQRPEDSRPSKLADLAAATKDGVLVVFGNYLFRFSGWTPAEAADLEPLLSQIPNVDHGPVPTLRDYLPADGRIPNSERYLLGPDSLDRFEPGIPPSVAAFSMGAEAELARFQTKGGSMQMAIFSYPTPQIAIQRLPEFQKLPGAVARRSGPLVSVILKPPDSDQAERLLAQVKYQATITLNERVPTRRDNIGDLVVNAFLLVGILIGLFIIAGLLFGFLRRWLGWGTSGEAMIVLHLEDR